MIRSVDTGYASPILLAQCGVYVVVSSVEGAVSLYDVTNGQLEGILSNIDVNFLPLD